MTKYAVEIHNRKTTEVFRYMVGYTDLKRAQRLAHILAKGDCYGAVIDQATNEVVDHHHRA